ncbi:MAG: hypothetical protein NT062_12035 [Proteobacteria bacterium]|nr:hypothetical protein [Pseudomonadota bacterium]
MRSSLAILVGLGLGLGCSLLPACVSSDDKGPEEELPPDGGKADSIRTPIDHGAIVFGAPATSALTADEHFHAWTFELTGDATVDLATTYAVRGQRKTDTVLYLYKEGAAGWGSYIARNDDTGNTVYSKLSRSLGAGRYRALVKGHLASTTGKFKLSVDCAGDGCAPPPPPSSSCLFGATFDDIATNPALRNNATQSITAATLATYTAEQQRRLVVAVQQSSHTDVMTPAEALAVVDQMEVGIDYVTETASLRQFAVYEYGVGDNSYGGIFDNQTGALVSSIHDGDLANCTVTTEVCLLPADYHVMGTDPAFTHAAVRVITSASQLSTSERAQAELTLRRVYGPATTVDQGIGLADRHQINVQTYRHIATGRDLTVIEFGAGDTSVGTIFYGTTTVQAGAIEDTFITGCTMFAT